MWLFAFAAPTIVHSQISGPAMASLYRVALTKAHLDQIPHDERIFYLMSSQLANDLNALAKLLIFASNGVGGDEIQRHVATTQAMLFVKVMAGRLQEGKVMLNKAFAAKRLWKKYKNDLSQDARTNYEAINEYFGRANLIEKIRNKFAFHSDVKVVQDTYEKAPSNAPFVDYLAVRYVGHSLYYGAEALTLNAMLKATGEHDSRVGLLKLIHEPAQVATWFDNFIRNFNVLMLSRYVGLSQDDLEARKVNITDGPVIDVVTLPFFCVPSEALLRTLGLPLG